MAKKAKTAKSAQDKRLVVTQEFYVQPLTYEANRVIGLAMSAAGLPDEEFFYLDFCGIRNVFHCTKSLARSFRQHLSDKEVRVYTRSVHSVQGGISELQDVTDADYMLG